MTGMEWLLEAVLTLLLSATLFHAVRLERALGALRRDRATLERLIGGFNDSTRLAEDGAERLRVAAEVAGKQITRQVDRANGLREDLLFLCDRSEKAADVLQRLVAEARERPSPLRLVPEPADDTRAPTDERAGGARSKAERDLIRALRLGR